MARPTLREKIGSEIAYQLRWSAMGFKTVMRCGGTVEVIHDNGKSFTIVVYDEDNPKPGVDKTPKVS